jgi:hypothetical protein
MINPNNITGKDYDLEEKRQQDQFQCGGLGPNVCGGGDVTSTSQKKIDASTPVNQPPNYSFYGRLTELLFQLQAYERGFDIYAPIRADSPTDFIINNGTKLIKIQCKSVFATNRSHYQIGLFGSGNGVYTAKDVDFFACYIFDTNQFFFVPFADVVDKKWFIVSQTNPQKQYLDNWDSLKNAS